LEGKEEKNVHPNRMSQSRSKTTTPRTTRFHPSNPTTTITHTNPTQMDVLTPLVPTDPASGHFVLTYPLRGVEQFAGRSYSERF